jgi:short-subunit dehydrogenase
LEGWSDCLRLELKPFGIDVVIIEPGIIVTEFGDVMLDPMVERSGKGAYADLTNKLAAATKKSYEKGSGSHPSVIAKVISKAVKSKKPKTRYSAGAMAKPILFMRKMLSDKAFDKMIMSQVK